MYSYIHGNYSNIGGTYKPPRLNIEHFFEESSLSKTIPPDMIAIEEDSNPFTIMPKPNIEIPSEEIKPVKEPDMESKLNQLKKKNQETEKKQAEQSKQHQEEINKKLQEVKKKNLEDKKKREQDERDKQKIRDKYMAATKKKMEDEKEKAKKIASELQGEDLSHDEAEIKHIEKKFDELVTDKMSNYDYVIQRMQEMIHKNSKVLSKK